MQKYINKIVRAGLISALYVCLSLITFPISSGTAQVRVAEAFTLLPLVFLEAVPALAVGCLITNLITGCAFPDIILGSLITFLAALLTNCVGKMIKHTALKIIVGGIFPVILNAFLLPLIWLWVYGAGEYLYIIQVCLLLAGQSLSVYAVGTPLYLAIKKYAVKF